MRHRKTDAHIATIRVSVPIDPMDVNTIQIANAAIKGLWDHLPFGSTVEVLNSRFGRVDAPVAAPAQMDLAMQQIRDSIVTMQPATRHVVALVGVDEATGQVVETVPISAGDGMDPPDSLRRVPRPAPNGGA